MYRGPSSPLAVTQYNQKAHFELCQMNVLRWRPVRPTCGGGPSGPPAGASQSFPEPLGTSRCFSEPLGMSRSVFTQPSEARRYCRAKRGATAERSEALPNGGCKRKLEATKLEARRQQQSQTLIHPILFRARCDVVESGSWKRALSPGFSFRRLRSEAPCTEPVAPQGC